MNNSLIPVIVVLVVIVLALVFWYEYRHKKSHPNKDDVEEYLKKNFSGITKTYGDKCFNCLKDKIVSLWSNKEYDEFKKSDKDKQKKYIIAMLAFNCSKECVEPEPKLNPGEVLQWLVVHLPGASKDCYRCMTDFIVKNWSSEDFQKLEGYSMEKQAEALQALVGFSCSVCDKDEKPEKLSKAGVEKYLEVVLGDDNIPDKTMECLVKYTMAAIDLATFKKFKKEIKASRGDLTNISDEQKKFLEMLSNKCSN